jgi:hypothetical protein
MMLAVRMTRAGGYKPNNVLPSPLFSSVYDARRSSGTALNTTPLGCHLPYRTADQARSAAHATVTLSDKVDRLWADSDDCQDTMTGPTGERCATVVFAVRRPTHYRRKRSAALDHARYAPTYARSGALCLVSRG